jgi:hypothetical protein
MTGTKGSTEQTQVVEFRRGIRQMLQGRLSEAIEALLEEELEGVLGSGWYAVSAGAATATGHPPSGHDGRGNAG